VRGVFEGKDIPRTKFIHISSNSKAKMLGTLFLKMGGERAILGSLKGRILLLLKTIRK
jgi:hypothetical protein